MIFSCQRCYLILLLLCFFSTIIWPVVGGAVSLPSELLFFLSYYLSWSLVGNTYLDWREENLSPISLCAPALWALSSKVRCFISSLFFILGLWSLLDASVIPDPVILLSFSLWESTVLFQVPELLISFLSLEQLPQAIGDTTNGLAPCPHWQACILEIDMPGILG